MGDEKLTSRKRDGPDVSLFVYSDDGKHALKSIIKFLKLKESDINYIFDKLVCPPILGNLE